MRTISTILAAAAAIAAFVVIAPVASASQPCSFANGPNAADHAAECTSCLNANSTRPDPMTFCGGHVQLYRPTCAQGVICGPPAAYIHTSAFRTGGPCQYAGDPSGRGGGANGQACQACINSLMPNPQAPNLCGAPQARGPACEQAGVCGNAYHTYPQPPCPPDCAPPGTFPTGRVPLPTPYTPPPPPDQGWPSGPNDTWLR